MGNSISHISGRQSGMNVSTSPQDTAQSSKRNIEFDDSASPRKRRLLESYSTGDPPAKCLYREASDVFLKRKADINSIPSQ
ncbi:hypothetical protein DFJ58DRAFT_734656 [Suillus subalutaceus]|uniref:uncharacterized protein n=1 Tax=Suillus subalutaceus TaxID=48586 RepID=UPI001B873B0B|nr:uncharacterized protein DFJ58DRAFT_734656 [Suillus subalutaceus]KAG1836957.1 hypothetical protein DFJ58DRAFT_734656 [Suillus subalutaceus]